MINKNTTLGHYIKIIPEILSNEECDYGFDILLKSQWKKHKFNNEAKKITYSYEDDLEINYGQDNLETKNFTNLIMGKIYNVLLLYSDYSNLGGWNGYSAVKYNKYSVNTCMHRHWDSIYTLFDGQRRGVPAVSIVGSLNDNYVGGEFIMFDDTIIKIPKGGVLVFPSSFMFWHEVKPVIDGIRMTFVSWAW
jgi:predicted 2-oxoglutarate/Fe(II)-dependent dioxygenase YbiX